MQFYDLDGRLVVTIDDGAAVWRDGGWMVTTPEHARKAFLEGIPLDAATAASEFPDAELGMVPISDLEAMNAKAMAAATDTDESALDAIEGQLDAEG